jgi:hypothetical protein
MNKYFDIITLSVLTILAPFQGNAAAPMLPCWANQNDSFVIEKLDFENYQVHFRHKFLPVKCQCYIGSGGDIVAGESILNLWIKKWEQDNKLILGVDTSISLSLQNEQCEIGLPSLYFARKFLKD